MMVHSFLWFFFTLPFPASPNIHIVFKMWAVYMLCQLARACSTIFYFWWSPAYYSPKYKTQRISSPEISVYRDISPPPTNLKSEVNVIDRSSSRRIEIDRQNFTFLDNTTYSRGRTAPRTKSVANNNIPYAQQYRIISPYSNTLLNYYHALLSICRPYSTVYCISVHRPIRRIESINKQTKQNKT